MMSVLKNALLTTSFVLMSNVATAGLQIKDGQLVDKDSNVFIIRGINHAHTWFPEQIQAYADIAKTGANTVRVVLSNGARWDKNNADEVAKIIRLCQDNHLITILEVHDATGWGEAKEAASIMTAVDYWTSPEMLAVIEDQEDTVIINIANEPFGNKIEPLAYVNLTIDAIKAMREAGIKHTLMIDAHNWGQDWQFGMRDHAEELAEADANKNLLFDVHMYEVFNKAEIVKSYLQSFADKKLPLVIGEFGADHQGKDVAEDAILEYAEEFGIGYIGWSWSGNGDCCTSLDITIDFDPESLSPWGERLINGENGIAQTSKPAKIYDN